MPKKRPFYMISAVAEMFNIHPQTLRTYEREGLIRPSRSQGNTRLYSQEDVERIELILRLTKELGVNLAGVEVILNMRDRMFEMMGQMNVIFEAAINRVRQEMENMETRNQGLVHVGKQELVRNPGHIKKIKVLDKEEIVG